MTVSPRLAAALAGAAILAALSPRPGAGQTPASTVPELDAVRAVPTSEMRPVVERFVEDRRALARRYEVPFSSARRERMRTFLTAWRDSLSAMDYESLGVEGRIDWHLVANDVRYGLSLLEREERELAEMAGLVPFLAEGAAVVEAWRSLEDVDARASAEAMIALADEVETARSAVAAGDVSPVVARRAAGAVANLRRALGRWYDFHAGYDPAFTWWVAEPWERAGGALDGWAATLREELAGLDGDRIVGDPIGAEGLAADLAHEMIPYTPAELVTLAEREFRWIEARMREAARDMGHGDDWRAALEEVKDLHVPPGEQPELVRMLAREAVDFVRNHDLVTVPPLAEEIWRMSMLSPERQRVSPFFLGGEVIQISFPTPEMAHDEKLMSMRGNNIHFSRATVHHELIPGHHLQGFMTDRYNPHRDAFDTPFWTEGWALWFEFQLWDRGFPSTPEDRMGMLFWRAHRAARIIFSLSFHLGTMTPEEAVDFLVARVGHERANAEAEVRRSFGGSYPPLYQAAYMLGALQLRALHNEVVGAGRTTDRAFHDTILRGGRMPIELVRARLLGTLLPRDHRTAWRFAGEVGG